MMHLMKIYSKIAAIITDRAQRLQMGITMYYMQLHLTLGTTFLFQQRKKDQASFMRLEKDFNRKEDNLNMAIDRTEKMLSSQFMKQFQDIEQTLMSFKERVEFVHESAGNMLEQMNFKLKKVDETEKVKAWCSMQMEELLVQLRYDLKKQNQDNYDDFMKFKSLFNLPGIVGQTNKFTNIREFLLDQMQSIKQNHIDLTKLIVELEQNSITPIESKLMSLNHQFDQYIQEQNDRQKHTLDTLQQEVNYVMSLIREQNKQNDSLRLDIDEKFGNIQDKFENGMEVVHADLRVKDQFYKDIQKELNKARNENQDNKQSLDNAIKEINIMRHQALKQVDTTANKPGSSAGIKKPNRLGPSMTREIDNHENPNLVKRVAEIEKILDSARSGNSNNDNQNTMSFSKNNYDIPVTSLSNKANDPTKRLELMDKQIKTLIKKFEVFSRELRSNTAIINKLKATTFRNSNNSNTIEFDESPNQSDRESLRSNRNLRVNIEKHLKADSSKNRLSQGSFYKEPNSGAAYGDTTPKGLKIGTRFLQDQDDENDFFDINNASTPKDVLPALTPRASKFQRNSLKVESKVEDKNLSWQDSNTQNLIRLQKMIEDKKTQEEAMNPPDENPIDKPQTRILEELKVKQNDLNKVQKRISLHNALGTKEDNPLKLALEQIPKNTSTTRPLNQKRQSADNTKATSIADSNSNRMQLNGRLTQTLGEGKTRDHRLSQTVAQSPKEKDALNTTTANETSLAYGKPNERITLKNQIQRPQKMNQSNDQSFTNSIQNQSQIKPLYIIKEQSLEQVIGGGQSASGVGGTNEFLPQISNSNRQPIPQEELKKIQNSIASNKSIQERRRLTNHITSLSNVGVLMQQQLFGQENTQQQIYNEYQSSQGAGQFSTKNSRQGTADFQGRKKELMIPLEVKFEKLDTSNGANSLL
ncbi:UNKNOWN [Stylonychia lemnae]|uniref:Uncharacterized protein n=1 Tax=Stylonychia lemnae TaxID=5949 RepID=A0A078A760_STYLE|nr:UNKNOWN [Stylonychia lemnae]|eukprot:CDW77721.1 UNKNOWN [Stylonychia lemnae]